MWLGDMVRLPTVAFVAGTTVAVAIACAAAKPVSPPVAAAAEESKSESMAGWPEAWGVEFGLRCAAAGEDVRFCTCLANAVQKRWTPEQFRPLGPEGLRDDARACRRSLGEVEAK
jgi:hypothetical protein